MSGFCKTCGKGILEKSKQCKTCSNREKVKKVNWPSDKDLLNMLKTKTQKQIAEDLNVSKEVLQRKLMGIRR